jgi:hypothetical protein
MYLQKKGYDYVFTYSSLKVFTLDKIIALTLKMDCDQTMSLPPVSVLFRKITWDVSAVLQGPSGDKVRMYVSMYVYKM